MSALTAAQDAPAADRDSASRAAAELDAEHQRLLGLLPGLDVLPLWQHYQQIVTREPAQTVPSHLWRWSDLEPAVELAMRAVRGHDADHRVFVLKHPGLEGRVGTCTTILGAIQCVLPGERTVEHRHTPSTVRVVLRSDGGGTFVDGKRCEMLDGDFIVTPSWTWHCHHNDSAAPALWVDILDVPFVKHLNSVFGRPGPADGYPQDVSTLPDAAFAQGGIAPVDRRAEPRYTPQFRYAWSDVERAMAALEPEADGTRRVRYVNPRTGEAVVPTLDCSVLALAGGRPTRAERTTAAALCVVLSGEGRSRVGDIEHRWRARDIFTLPEWQWTEHVADSERAHLVMVSDANVKRLLGLLREERRS